MKFQAAILLIPLLSYFSETLNMPIDIPEPSVKSSCCSSMKKSGQALRTPLGEKNSEKNNDNNCTGMTCLNCPLCFSFTALPSMLITDQFCITEKQYLLIEEKLISDYFSKS